MLAEVAGNTRRWEIGDSPGGSDSDTLNPEFFWEFIINRSSFPAPHAPIISGNQR